MCSGGKSPRRDAIRRPAPVEAHVGIATTEPAVGGWTDFRRLVLPRVVALGYTAVLLMAVQEHAYYGSFGYQVTSYFTPSSRFGTAEEFGHACAFFCSARAGYITGQNLVLDGGGYPGTL